MPTPKLIIRDKPKAISQFNPSAKTRLIRDILKNIMINIFKVIYKPLLLQVPPPLTVTLPSLLLSKQKQLSSLVFESVTGSNPNVDSCVPFATLFYFLRLGTT